MTDSGVMTTDELIDMVKSTRVKITEITAELGDLVRELRLRLTEDDERNQQRQEGQRR